MNDSSPTPTPPPDFPEASPIEAIPTRIFDAAADREATARAAAAAAPSAPERPDLAMSSTLDDSVRPIMFALLRNLADNKYVLGRRYAEWCTGAPALESAVAAAAMAQDELGHARSFYPLLRGFPEGSEQEASAMEERGWQQHPTSALACLDRRFPDWPTFIAANLVVDTAFTVFFAACADTPYEPLGQRARKILQEESGHWVHAQGWVQRLAQQDERRAQLAEGLRAMWPHALAWYGPSNDPLMAGLARAGLIAQGPDELRQQLEIRLRPVLGEATLEAVVDTPIPWSAWDESARRLEREA